MLIVKLDPFLLVKPAMLRLDEVHVLRRDYERTVKEKKSTWQYSNE